MTPFVDDPDFTLYVGSALEVLRELPERSVNCCVTSPPYWGLRDYGTDGQIGLEETPEVFVSALVEVFREVRRVLSDDGTLWLNLGDSYVSAPRGNAPGDFSTSSLTNPQRQDSVARPQGTTSARAGRQNAEEQRSVSWRIDGLKAKDLAGIPWKVAQALQAPQYTGRISVERDRVWLAATVDAEGTICGFDHTRADDGSHRSGVHITITNTSSRLLDEAARIWPTSRSEHQHPTAGHLGTKQSWRWIVHGIDNKLSALRDLYPYLIVKREQAVVAYSLLLLMKDAKRLGHSSQKDAVLAKRRVLTGLLSDLNHGRPVDLPSWLTEPPSLYEPGWYLRSDIVWAKPNPMPESVTDRPTKSHEYVFLLSKSPRYFFDQEAVREPAEWARWGAQTVRKPQPGTASWIKPKGKQELLGEQQAKMRGGDTKSGFNDRWAEGDNPTGRNIRTVWDIATQPYADAHFATFPEELPRRCIAAGCPEWVCGTCGKARVREMDITYRDTRPGGNGRRDGEGFRGSGVRVMGSGRRLEKDVETTGFSDCGHDNYRPGVVLDPFMGSGTTALVARKLGRRAVGIELSPEYAALCARRLQQLSLLA